MSNLIKTAALVAACGCSLVACSGDDDAGESPPPVPTFSIGGTVTGLPSGASVTLGNGPGRVVVGADGRFVFDAPQAEGSTYRVGVLDAPDDRRCEVTRGRGSMPAANIDDVTVDCSHVLPWQVGGSIRSTALSDDGNTLYIGGHFDWIGQPTGSFAKLNAANGKPIGAFAKVSGRVVDAAPDGEGGWYVAGSFVRVNGTEATGLVHVFEDGTLDEQFAPGPDAPVYAIVRSGSTLLVGGAFTRIGGATRSRLAALDAATGQALPWSAGAAADVCRIAAQGSTVYVAGDFLLLGGLPRAGLGALEMKSGNTLPWNPKPHSSYDPDGRARIGSVLVADSMVYIGGRFDTIGGAARHNAAALDPVTGMASAWNPRCSYGAVNAMAKVDGVIYITGDSLYSVGGQARTGLAAVDAVDGAALAWNPTLLYYPVDDAPWPGTGESIAVLGDTVYVGGNFNYPSTGLAAFSRTTGEALHRPHLLDGRARVHTLHVDGEHVLVGGDFMFVGGKRRGGLAALDTRTGRATDWGPMLSGVDWRGLPTGAGINVLLRSGGTLLAGGDFQRVDGYSRSALAAFDLPSGNLSAWAPNVVRGGDSAAYVSAMSLAGSTLYFTGAFSLLNGQPRNGLAAIDVRTGAAEPWNPPFLQPSDSDSDKLAFALAVADSVVYVGGRFTSLFGEVRSGLAAFDRTTGALTPWKPGALRDDQSAGEVRAMVLSGPVLHVGGSFDWIGGQGRRHLAALDAASGTVRIDWGSVDGTPQAVSTLALSGGALYFGTYDDTVGRIDAATGAPLKWGGALFTSGVYSLSTSVVYALSFSPQTVYVGGRGLAFVPK